MTVRERLAPVGVVLGMAAGLVSGYVMVGQPAKLSGVLTLFFAGAASGASFTALRFKRRLAQTTAAHEPTQGV